MNSVGELFRSCASASSRERASNTYERMAADCAGAVVLGIGRFCLAVLGWIPLTLFGVAGLIAGWFVWQFAAKHGDGVLWGAVVAGVGLIGLSSVIVLVTGLVLRFRPQPAVGPLSTETGAPLRTGLRLGIAGWNPLLRIEVSWQRPVAGKAEIRYERGEIFEEFWPSERVLVSEVVRQYVVRDVFGLARVRFRRRSPLELKVEPHCGRARQSEVVKQQVSGDIVSHPEGMPAGDLLEMRRYTPGDPLKLVLWKLYARSGELLVRTPERAISTSRNTVLYLASATGDEPAAGICRAALLAGSGAGLLFGTDGDQPPTSADGEALVQLARSSAARCSGGSGLARALALGAKQGCQACVLFVSPQPGVWLERVTGTLATFSGRCTAVIGVDGLPAEEQSKRRWSRWLLDAGPGEPAKAGDLRETARRLEAAGAEVLIIDRITGHTHAPMAL